jgi:serine/threonine-protein kinase
MSIREQLDRTLGATLTIERELGGGGMSHVFVADDRKLGRKIVVKVLAPEKGAVFSAERFAREIKLAAALQHPHIVPVLAAGDAEGTPYYTMPFVDGESLRARLAKGPLAIDDAVSILRDVAKALAFAHGRGVVHRDIKPENILLAGDSAVVTDFGVAKAVHDARTTPNVPSLRTTDFTLTEAGTSVGTPAYMAPEQAVGDPSADHRADIYAFGCVAYELFVGEPPFGRQPMHQLLVAHINETPARASTRRSDVPPALDALIARCLEKSPAARPQSAGELLQTLGGAATPAAQQTRAPSRKSLWIVIGLLILLGLAVMRVRS